MILSRAVSGLFPIVSSAHFSFGHRVSLHVLRDHSLREDIVLRLTESGAHSGVRRFLKEHFLSDESVLHVLFKLRRALVALSDGALNQVLLLGSRDLVAVHGNVRDSGERRGAREDDAGENGGGGFHLHWNDSKKNRWFGQRVGAVFRDVETHREREGEREAKEAEKLEIHPGFRGERVSNREVDKPDHDEEPDPALLEVFPDVGGKGDLSADQLMNEVLSGHAAVDQDRGKDPVEDRRLPLDEKRIVEPDREAAEDRNDRERQPQHDFHLLAAQQHKGDLQD